MEETLHKILIVDDEKPLQTLLSTVLSTEKRMVLIAGTMAEACKLVDENNVNIIVLDRMLPDGDGLEFCAKLRSTAVHKGIPILLLSGKADINEKVFGLKLGGDDYLGKPFDVRELRARVDALLRRTEELNKYKHL